jgi:hypothetical protein
MFYAVELLLTIRYLHRSSHSLLHKSGVGGMFAFDTICTAAIFVRVYNVFLGFPLNVQPHNSSITNTIGVILLSTYGTASLEQLFLCCLYFNLWVARSLRMTKASFFLISERNEDSSLLFYCSSSSFM